MGENCEGYSWLAVRIALGFTMIWAFFDKLLGLGFATCRDKTTHAVNYMCSNSWLGGGSPTTGFLKFGAEGPLGELIQKIFTSHHYITNGFGRTLVVDKSYMITDVLFMIGMLGIGLALLLGAGMRLAGYSGALIMLFMYLASFVPENNPITDDHIINLTIFILLAVMAERATAKYSLAKWWNNLSFVKDKKWLQ